MKTQHSAQRKGVTLIELSLVIGIILVLVSTSSIGISFYKDWQKGLAAGEDLKAVYQAQKLFLADNPTVDPTDDQQLNATLIAPYLPNNMNAVPTITGLDGISYTIDVNTSPPSISKDFSSSTSDSLWDTGK